MTQFNEYLTSEVVEDYSDGIIARREALRRLGLLGVAAGVALPLLAACDAAGQEGTTAPPTPSAAGGSPAGPAPLPTEAISFDGPEGRTLMGAWAAAEDSARCGPGRAREPRPHRPHPFRGRAAGGERLLRAGHRPAVGGGRHRVVRRRGRRSVRR